LKELVMTIAIGTDEAASADRRARILAVLGKSERGLGVFGLGWLVPLAKMALGEDLREQLLSLRDGLLIPLVGIGAFLLAWGVLAPQVKTSLGAIPGPVQVWQQGEGLWGEYRAERQREAEFYARQDARNAELAASGQTDMVRHRSYTGQPTYLDQILTSLKTVGLGFLISTLVAVPLGIASGLSPAVNSALNPLVQLFKPVSPLAWLPIVTMVVSAAYANVTGAMPSRW